MRRAVDERIEVVYLKPGDRVRIRVPGIGDAWVTVIAAPMPLPTGWTAVCGEDGIVRHWPPDYKLRVVRA